MVPNWFESGLFGGRWFEIGLQVVYQWLIGVQWLKIVSDEGWQHPQGKIQEVPQNGAKWGGNVAKPGGNSAKLRCNLQNGVAMAQNGIAMPRIAKPFCTIATLFWRLQRNFAPLPPGFATLPPHLAPFWRTSCILPFGCCHPSSDTKLSH